MVCCSSCFMAPSIALLVTLIISVFSTRTTMASSANFSQLFQPYWAPNHIISEHNLIKLLLDADSGCGFESKGKYLFGKTSAKIKLVEGDSAGTVTAFYMSSEGDFHDELDFEFLGNSTGEPYLVQTNIYVNGSGNREMRHSLWFDPTLDFHTYAFFWNHHSIQFLVDDIPIRVFTNEESGVPYPKAQAMGIYASVWNADDWATQGGRVKTNWTHAPFVSTFRSFQIDACESTSPEDNGVAAKCGRLGQFWWDMPAMNELNKRRIRQLKWVRANHLVYDYCDDAPRFTQLPPECQLSSV